MKIEVPTIIVSGKTPRCASSLISCEELRMLRHSRPALLAAAAAVAAAAVAGAGAGAGAAPRRHLSFQKVGRHMSLIRAEVAGTAPAPVPRASTASAPAVAAAATSPVADAAAVGQKPLVVMLPWLLAKRAHISKYARLYTDHGLDVLGVHSNPGHLLRPVKGSQVVAGELLSYLKQLPGRAPLLLHGFSVGGYLWGEALVQLRRQAELRDALEKRFVGQIWDSVAEISEAPAGLARSFFPQTAALQNIVEKAIKSYLSLFYETSARHYELSSHHFHRHPIHCPALLLLSRSDPIGTVSANEKLLNDWKKIDIPTYVKIWEGSSHVGHFRMYRAEYEDQVSQFLEKLGLVNKK